MTDGVRRGELGPKGLAGLMWCGPSSAPEAAVSVMSSGKPHQSQDLQTGSCGLVARP